MPTRKMNIIKVIEIRTKNLLNRNSDFTQKKCSEKCHIMILIRLIPKRMSKLYIMLYWSVLTFHDSCVCYYTRGGGGI